jgi:hypothetical protein
MKNNRFFLLAVPFMGLVLLAMPVKAGSILPKRSKGIDFSSQSNPGNVQHAGGTASFTEGFGNSLIVNDAPIFQLHAPAGNHGPSKNGQYAVADGSLDIVTGGCISGCTHINKNGSQSLNFSGAGSSLKLTGEIAGLGIDSPETLVLGYFSQLGSAKPATHVNLKPGGGGLNGYLIITYINPMIVDLLHLTHASGEGDLTELYLNMNFLPSAGTWSGQVGASNLFVAPTPEPTNLILLGTALLAVAWVTRKVRA